MTDVEDSYWRRFAAEARRLGSPLYERLALGVDADAGLKSLAARARPGQPHANILFAAVNFLMLRGADHPLKDFYPALGGTAGGDAFPAFRDFVERHAAAMAPLLETRVTNTNEAARSAILRAGFAALGERESLPLHLIEIGPSAGLNLNWDRYGMRYRRGGRMVAEIPVEAGPILDCALRGAATSPLATPTIARRVGLERDPVDLSDRMDRDWLRALVWPDQPHRLARLDEAIALFHRHPQEIHKGDALALLPDALARVSHGEAACVYHTIAVYQFSAAMKESLAAILATAGLRRPVWHLAFEFDGVQDYVLTLTRHAEGTAETCMLAVAEAHGGWIEWCGDT